ncbi:hypothetical protein DFH07DRAFT_832471 [Mycena maculata]|uniref:Uncharacterized protein n=1 Tax=Mycena maculata TaxID=230809 RepID=A0AAD7IMW4_9AGAR|nr:hypothetical protein DFH07DRAFT_832471 [Mycena maculata]
MRFSGIKGVPMGAMNKESSLTRILTMAATSSSNYQDETSEMFIGEWEEKRNIRDQLVIATKV